MPKCCADAYLGNGANIEKTTQQHRVLIDSRSQNTSYMLRPEAERRIDIWRYKHLNP